MCFAFVYCTAGLGEFKLRDLNDEINKLLREKGHWEDQIKVLGGPDYRVISISSIVLLLTSYFLLFISCCLSHVFCFQSFASYLFLFISFIQFILNVYLLSNFYFISTCLFLFVFRVFLS